jgi:type IV secretory pathway protease TraF
MRGLSNNRLELTSASRFASARLTEPTAGSRVRIRAPALAAQPGCWADSERAKMERVATVVLQQAPQDTPLRLGQVRYLPDPERPEYVSLVQRIALPGGGSVSLESECVDATGRMSMRVQHEDREVLRALCRWREDDPPFLRVHLHGVGQLTLQFVPGLLRDGGPELGEGR